MDPEYQLPENPACPFCDGVKTELHSPFGSALSVATYWCRSCRTAFEWVKWAETESAPRRAPGQERETGQEPGRP